MLCIFGRLLEQQLSSQMLQLLIIVQVLSVISADDLDFEKIRQ